MKPTVRLSFGPTEVICHLPEGSAAQPPEEARRWLDEQFVAYECEPLRALGKVLTRDKLIALADAIGPRGFEADEKLRGDFARAAAAVLGREGVHIDVDARQVSF
ncbi:MAG: hypothetical protein IPM15_00870 [Betaproteobacteria bacterium]|nr:hypothetical protein [Betaproteobacteria bacterium]MCC6250653.1 hypothetical protein [Rubrivivax sp.]MCL4697170.1 hypothetical protein [Burkholderiaceae bacterium]